MSEMKNWLNKKSFNIKDEYYTPKVLVEPILKYIDKDLTVWCPFDTENSEFVLMLKENGNKVIYSHLKDDKDFFNYEPENYDIIVSNPPFSRKLEVLDRLYKINKPFAMLLGLPILNYNNICDFYLDKELQLLIVNKKVSFDGNQSSFNTSYFCYNLLPKDILFAEIKNNNARKHYEPSRMYEDFKKEDEK